ncbi:arylesterase/monooxygenase [Cadophora sp. DSE1049]|nr:arylesterase/monooxygenase [Cadophora sp. DSE1049]
MSLKFDPDFLEATASYGPDLTSATLNKPAIHDVETRRAVIEKMITTAQNNLPTPLDVEETVYYVKAADGYDIPIYAFLKRGRSSATVTSALLHCHGGGMISGSVAMCRKEIANQVSRLGVPMYSVDYRLAPEHRHPTLVEDCYAGLVWLYNNAEKLAINTERIGVLGESAGGGIAAGVALMARDKNLQPPLAKQILIYPMLDDRNNQADPVLEQFAGWKNEDNITAWTALLGSMAGNPQADLSYYAAPARVKSVRGLPPTYIDVGELDIFRGEDIKYAMRIAQENINTEFHLYPGVPHGFELWSLNASVTKRALENRARAILSF